MSLTTWMAQPESRARSRSAIQPAFSDAASVDGRGLYKFNAIVPPAAGDLECMCSNVPATVAAFVIGEHGGDPIVRQMQDVHGAVVRRASLVGIAQPMDGERCAAAEETRQHV